MSLMNVSGSHIVCVDEEAKIIISLERHDDKSIEVLMAICGNRTMSLVWEYCGDMSGEHVLIFRDFIREKFYVVSMIDSSSWVSGKSFDDVIRYLSDLIKSGWESHLLARCEADEEDKRLENF